MTFTPLTTAETDAKSPMDDLLWQKVREDLADLDSRVAVAGAAPFPFEVSGKLSHLRNWRTSVAAGYVNKAFTPTICRFMLKKSGTSSLVFDIRKHSSLRIPITEIAHQFNAATSSISRRGSALSTQNITRATAQISTQSITHAKASNNVSSIILLGTDEVLGSNLVQYNLASTVDSDSVVGDGVIFASCTTGANNGTFTIVAINRGGGNNIVITNASGAAQTGAAGTAQLKIMSYNFTNPVDATNFVAGKTAHFATHTSGANDGELTIYAINSGGNNILVKNNTGVVQGGAAGTCDTNFFKFNMSTAVSTTDYIAGEKALTASHSTGANNGSFTIISVNTGGNNLVLHVSGGATQGGVAGTVNTYRWDYNLPSDPTTNVSVGYTMDMSSHTSSVNDGTFTVMAVTASTVVIYNEAGAAQGGPAGNVYTTRKLVKFGSDQSASFTVTTSYIEMKDCVDRLYNEYFAIAPFQVIQVNRGGGANYNVVIDCTGGSAQASPAGYVYVEMKSIFNTAPTLASDVTSQEPNLNLTGTSTDFVSGVIAAQTPLMLYVTTLPSGDPQDLAVTLT